MCIVTLMMVLIALVLNGNSHVINTYAWNYLTCIICRRLQLYLIYANLQNHDMSEKCCHGNNYKLLLM